MSDMENNISLLECHGAAEKLPSHSKGEIMKKLLVVVDMQNDFVTGSLSNKSASEIIPNIEKKIYQYQDWDIVFTQDTHTVAEKYLATEEGKNLPVPHCQYATQGWMIVPQLRRFADVNNCIIKTCFGSNALGEYVREHGYNVVELCGTVTEICVISNALLVRAFSPNVHVIVDSSCCAGLSPEGHEAALTVMRSCQVEVI